MHEAISDYLIANPEARGGDVAEFFKVSESWLSIIKNSDAFKQFHSAKRKEHFDNVSADVVAKLTATAEMSLDEINFRLEAGNREKLTLRDLGETAKIALGGLGFGRDRGGGSTTINDNRTLVVNDAVALAKARERQGQLRELNDRVIEGELA